MRSAAPLRTLTAQLVVTGCAIAATATTIALLFVLSVKGALAVGAYSAAALAAAYALITFPRRAIGAGFALAAALLVFAIGGTYRLGSASTWAAVLVCAVTSVSVFSTRRNTRNPYLPTVAALTVIVAAFWATAALGLPRWLWVAPALIAGLAAVGWRADWRITWRAPRRLAVEDPLPHRRTAHHQRRMGRERRGRSRRSQSTDTGREVLQSEVGVTY